MTFPEKHFLETKKILLKIDPSKIAAWLLEQGYYAEQYVLPPNFSVKKFELGINPYFKVSTKGKYTKFDIDQTETIEVSFPKSHLTERTLGIIMPKVYHDIVWYLCDEWESIIQHLFQKDIKIYSYSFPIPISSKAESEIGCLRAGRMIYEFLEMAENDIVAEAHQYSYLLKTDVKNCYPSIYTHSIPWALHGKNAARKDRGLYSLLGTKLDKLFQYANDTCTNGIPIGPAVSDLIAEVILAAVDKNVSIELAKENLEFIGVRFRDDYRFLCKTKSDAERIVKMLQKHLKSYNLALNEKKSDIKGLPEGLYRPWVADYNSATLKYKKSITYKRFEHTFLKVLKIDTEHPDTGVIDRFLSELTTKKFKLKLSLNGKEIIKVFSLLLMLKERRAKSFPQILAIIELLFTKYTMEQELKETMTRSIQSLFNEKMNDQLGNCYDILWLAYFIESNSLFRILWPKKLNHPFIRTVKKNSQSFYLVPDINLYTSIKKVTKTTLIEHVAIFKRTTEAL